MMLYRLEVMLLDIHPAVIRNIEISSATTLAQFHLVLQEAMGWENCHMHAFEQNDKRWGEPDPDSETLAEDSVTLGELLHAKDDVLYYTYDFGDSWEHQIALDEIVPGGEASAPPCVLSGKRSCPPEDCGGPFGYQNLLKVLASPKHKEHRELKKWVGKKFDPEHFSVDEANRRMARVKKS